jgi:hypothetical protein
MLVERLSRLRHGLPVPDVPLRCDGAAPYGWAAAARIVEEQINDLIRPQHIRRERDRHEAVLLLDEWAHAQPSDAL